MKQLRAIEVGVLALGGCALVAAVWARRSIIAAHRPVRPIAQSAPAVAAFMDGAGVDSGLPLAVVDVDNFDYNVKSMVRIASVAGKKIRIATKSVRSVALLRRIANAVEPGMLAGLMTFTAAESLALLRDHEMWRVCKHLLIAYPIGDVSAAADVVRANLLQSDCTVAAMVDSIVHVELLERAVSAVSPGTVKIPVWIDVDMSWRPGGAMHVGVRRSPVRTVDEVTRLAKVIAASPHVYLEGIMGYEAQIAGLQDYASAGFVAAVESLIRSIVKHHSVETAAHRRSAARAAAAAVAGCPPAALQCNGGGSGSLRTTVQDSSVTEVTIGSGALCGHLFDNYLDADFRPALHVLLRVSRVPAPGIVTCHGGGWVASGEAGASRLPLIVHPLGARYIGMEGAGEVQTPIVLPSGCRAKVGDIVVVRPTKSGELGEVFRRYLMLKRRSHGHVDVGEVRTYRGENVQAWGGM